MVTEAERLVDSDLGGCAICYLASVVIECDRLQLRIVVVVDGLNDGIGAVENGKGTSGDVGLMKGEMRIRSYQIVCSPLAECEGALTLKCVSSQ